MHKRYLTLLSCCLVGAAVAGCGSSNGSSAVGNDAATSSVSPQAFSNDLNALCKQGNAAARKVSNDPAKLLATVDQFLPKFKALTASGSQQATYNNFQANIRAEIAALKAGNVTTARAAAAKNKGYAAALHAPACA